MRINRNRQAGATTARSRSRTRAAGRRRGMSLVMVMVAVSMSLVLTFSFMRTQTTTLQISQNADHRDLALSAAHSGATMALGAMQDPQWGGVDSPLARTVFSDDEGTSSYAVEFSQFPTDGSREVPDDVGLYVVVESTGTWQSASDLNMTVTRTVEVVVRLAPRVAGRAVGAGDSAAAEDESENPGDYDSIQSYAVHVRNGGDCLTLDPRDRIDGNVWLDDRLRMFKDPHWSGGIRSEYVQSIGRRLGAAGSLTHPHPLRGHLTLKHSPSSSVQSDLAALNVSYSSGAEDLVYPTFDFEAFRTYRIYEGGFVYSAQSVSSTLSNRTLRPTPDNPLGVFYYPGSVTIYDNVTIQGTLAATGTVTINGNNVVMTAFDWRGTSGEETTPGGTQFRRLPAIIASDVRTDRTTRAVIEGAVALEREFRGGGGDYKFISAVGVNLAGTATVVPLQQPWSKVQLENIVDLSQVHADGSHSIWIQKGNTGSWHPIVGVDSAALQLRVVGELAVDAPVFFRIRPTRNSFFTLRGPFSAEKIDVNRPEAWAAPSGSDWDLFYANWQLFNTLLAVSEIEPVEFSSWLEDPVNLTGETYPNNTYGLTLEPTFEVSRPAEVRHRWEPPLFEAFVGGDADAEFSGYRWDVVSWRELN